MALSYPYSLAFFSDILPLSDFTPDLQRHDEYSGSGDSRFWTAELARPLWTASAALSPRPKAEAQAINAKVLGLDGSRRQFLFADPTYYGPASGQTSGLGAVTVNSIRADRGGMGLTGLPPGFVLSVSDQFTVIYGSGRVYFGKFLEGGTANASGVIASREIRPYLPISLTTGLSVILVRPYFKAFIPPGGFTRYTFKLGDYGAGASLTILQKA